MSIFEDIKGLFEKDTDGTDFVIYEYSSSSSSIKKAFEIYGVLSISDSQNNTVVNNPLEPSNTATTFTQDSKQIKPYSLTISGVLIQSEKNKKTKKAKYDITKDLATINSYVNSIKLLEVQTDYKIYAPLSLVSISTNINANQLYPLITLQLQQIQISNQSKYQNPRNQQNTPFSTKQG